MERILCFRYTLLLMVIAGEKVFGNNGYTWREDQMKRCLNQCHSDGDKNPGYSSRACFKECMKSPDTTIAPTSGSSKREQTDEDTSVNLKECSTLLQTPAKFKEVMKRCAQICSEEESDARSSCGRDCLKREVCIGAVTPDMPTQANRKDMSRCWEKCRISDSHRIDTPDRKECFKKCMSSPTTVETTATSRGQGGMVKSTKRPEVNVTANTAAAPTKSNAGQNESGGAGDETTTAKGCTEGIAPGRRKELMKRCREDCSWKQRGRGRMSCVRECVARELCVTQPTVIQYVEEPVEKMNRCRDNCRLKQFQERRKCWQDCMGEAMTTTAMQSRSTSMKPLSETTSIKDECVGNNMGAVGNERNLSPTTGNLWEVLSDIFSVVLFAAENRQNRRCALQCLDLLQTKCGMLKCLKDCVEASVTTPGMKETTKRITATSPTRPWPVAELSSPTTAGTSTVPSITRGSSRDCPPTFEYTDCAPKCVATCADPTPRCVRGGCKRSTKCVCPQNMVQPDKKNRTCIPLTQCKFYT